MRCGWFRYDDEEILATAVVLLASSTALLGVALWITGKLKLAGLVQ
jgi:SulP family sulfate permease